MVDSTYLVGEGVVYSPLSVLVRNFPTFRSGSVNSKLSPSMILFASAFLLWLLCIGLDIKLAICLDEVPSSGSEFRQPSRLSPERALSPFVSDDSKMSPNAESFLDHKSEAQTLNQSGLPVNGPDRVPLHSKQQAGFINIQYTVVYMYRSDAHLLWPPTFLFFFFPIYPKPVNFEA